MTESFSLDEIRSYWLNQSKVHGQSSSASWSDINVIKLEINEISKYLQDDDNILEVGCANGFTTVQYASVKNASIVGVDYIPEMIANANDRLREVEDRLKGKVQFVVDDVLKLKYLDESFNKVISTRVIINLGDWSTQLQGLKECARVLKPKGHLLLSEATIQGWQRMNSFRREWGLTNIPMPSFNNYLDEDIVVKSFSAEFDLVHISNFASTYYIGTRVLKPLLNSISGNKLDVADPNMEWNRWFSQLPAAGNYGTQKLFVFQKKC